MIIENTIGPNYVRFLSALLVFKGEM